METDYEEERKCHQESEEKLMEYGKERDRLKETIREGSEKVKKLEMELRMTKHSLEEKTDQLQQVCINSLAVCSLYPHGLFL